MALLTLVATLSCPQFPKKSCQGRSKIFRPRQPTACKILISFGFSFSGHGLCRDSLAAVNAGLIQWLKCQLNNHQTSTMASHEDITVCLGHEAAVYAANKHKGGSNGNKGTRYEDHFIAHKVVEAAVNLLEDQDADNPHIQGQVYGFVDDARIASVDATDYYQLKNKDSVSWTSGDRPLATDFKYQNALSRHLNEPAPSTVLVVPTATLAEKLEQSVPEDIKLHTAVHCFPWCQTASRLVQESAELRERLAKLSHVENASYDALYGVFYAFYMACLEKPEGATIYELLNCASQLSPTQLRLLPVTEEWEKHLREDVTKILAKIDGLVYGAKRGVFYWSGFGTSGIFESNVLSEEFKKFQDSIVGFNPKTFEEFERLLP